MLCYGRLIDDDRCNCLWRCHGEAERRSTNAKPSRVLKNRCSQLISPRIGILPGCKRFEVKSTYCADGVYWLLGAFYAAQGGVARLLSQCPRFRRPRSPDYAAAPDCRRP